MTEQECKLVLATNLRRYMAARDLMQQDVARALDVPATTFGNWFNGNNYPRIDKLEALANFFNIKKADLVEEYAGDDLAEINFMISKIDKSKHRYLKWLLRTMFGV